MNVHDAVEQFCSYSQYMRGYSPDTIRRYRGAVTGFLKAFPVRDLGELSIDSVRTWFFQGRTEKKWSAATFETYHKSLVVFFRWCVKEGHLAVSPVANIEHPKAQKRLPRRLTRDEAMQVLETVHNRPYPNDFLRCRNHAMFSTFLFAGLRKQELLRLETGDIDLQSASLLVRRGKGGKDRMIPIAEGLKESLARYVFARIRAKKTCPAFFTSGNRDAALSAPGLKDVIHSIKTDTGIRFSAHSLRHTFATLMLEGGCDIYSLSRMMGHSSITTTTIYLAATPQHLRSQITKHPLNHGSR